MNDTLTKEESLSGTRYLPYIYIYIYIINNEYQLHKINHICYNDGGHVDQTSSREASFPCDTVSGDAVKIIWLNLSVILLISPPWPPIL